jgi:hypothetical protein
MLVGDMILVKKKVFVGCMWERGEIKGGRGKWFKGIEVMGNLVSRDVGVGLEGGGLEE